MTIHLNLIACRYGCHQPIHLLLRTRMNLAAVGLSIRTYRPTLNLMRGIFDFVFSVRSFVMGALSRQRVVAFAPCKSESQYDAVFANSLPLQPYSSFALSRRPFKNSRRVLSAQHTDELEDTVIETIHGGDGGYVNHCWPFRGEPQISFFCPRSAANVDVGDSSV